MSRSSSGLVKRRGRAENWPASQELVDEALRLGHGTLLTVGSDGHVSVHSTERACPECGRSFQRWIRRISVTTLRRVGARRCRGFGELFYLPEVDRGARAEAIEESWFEWQEGKRERCPECGGARLNPVARAVRMAAGGASAAGRVLAAKGAPNIDVIGNAAAEDAVAFFRALKFTGREGAIARDILPEILSA